MAATRLRYRPPKNSERSLDPYNTCTIVSTWYGWMMETLGEHGIYPNGDPYLYSRCVADIREARAATGEPDRDGYGAQHLNTFFKTWRSPLTRKDVSFVRSRDDIIAALRDGHAIVMAGNTYGTRPDSPLRKWVGEADHRMIFMGLDDGTVDFIDPMTPRAAQHVRRCPVEDMFDFGDRFVHFGRYYAERYIPGRWTKASIVQRDQAALVLQVQQKLSDLTKEFRALDRELDDFVIQYNELDAKYTALLENTTPIDMVALREAVLRIEEATGDINTVISGPTTGK